MANSQPLLWEPVIVIVWEPHVSLTTAVVVAYSVLYEVAHTVEVMGEAALYEITVVVTVAGGEVGPAGVLNTYV